MRRREVLVAIAATLASPLSAQAPDSSRVRRLGVLATVSESDPEWRAEYAALTEALTEFGWIEGRNLQIDLRFGAGDPSRFASAAGELVSLKPDALLARSSFAVKALLDQTRTIPIVFVSAADPVGDGLAISLSRPRGNVTGFTNFEASMAAKWLELLKEIATRLRNVGVLFNPQTAVSGGAYFLEPIKAAAPAFGVAIVEMAVRTVGETEAAIAALAREPDPALLVPPDVFLVANRVAVIALASQHRLPAVYSFRNMAREGGLMSYGVDIADLYRRSASYVDRVLKGTPAGELPIQTPTKFELAVNLKTAKVLGLEAPATLLTRADELIE
jgi:putative ABC transport system substrate-binding protein